MDMPTGFSKTYSVIRYIANFIADENNKGKKIFFLTTLKKNLPLDELKEQLGNMGLAHLFEKSVLKLESNVDTAINNYTSNMLNDIPDDIRRSEEFKNFKADVEFLQSNTNPDFARSVRNNFTNNAERTFRKYLQTVLSAKLANAGSGRVHKP